MSSSRTGALADSLRENRSGLMENLLHSGSRRIPWAWSGSQSPGNCELEGQGDRMTR